MKYVLTISNSGKVIEKHFFSTANQAMRFALGIKKAESDKVFVGNIYKDREYTVLDPSGALSPTKITIRRDKQ